MTSPYGSQYPGDDNNNWNSQFGNPSGEQNYDQPYGAPYGQPYGQPFDQGFNAYSSPIPPEVPQPSMQEAQWRSFDLGTVFGQAWKGFTATWQAWVLSALIYFAVLLVLMFAWILPMVSVLAATSSGSDSAAIAAAGGTSFFGFMLMIVLAFISFVYSLNCYRNAARVVRGEQITIQSFFKMKGLGKALGIYILINIVIFIGMILLLIPGIIAAVVLIFAVPVAFQLRDASIGDAFSASWKAVSKNVGQVILLELAIFALSFLGSAVIIGMLVTTPLTFLLYAYAFQTASGGPIMQRQ
ncbi:hypothetical protein ACOI1A_14005 [Corynebacterium glutamicum]|uniref:hypothetical protein n=1 Tax=Corynebacterium glutamicum TaxID=1718 RepID=UPI003B6396DF